MLLFERERFPRYHIGESLLSASLPILEALGVMPAIEARRLHPQAGRHVRLGRAAPSRGASSFATIRAAGRMRFRWCASQFDHLLLRPRRRRSAPTCARSTASKTSDFDGARTRVTAIDARGATVAADAAVGDRRQRPAGAARAARPAAALRSVLQESGGVQLLRERRAARRRAARQHPLGRVRRRLVLVHSAARRQHQRRRGGRRQALCRRGGRRCDAAL